MDSWKIAAISVLSLFLICVLVFIVYKKCTNKRKINEKTSVFNGTILSNSMPLLGQTFRENKVQPDVEELANNLEDGKSDLEGEDGENKDDGVKGLGKLEFTIDYDFDKQDLTVGVLQANDLPAMDMGGNSDPYVKCYIMPDKKKKFETKVHRKTLNPVFNEKFVFKAIPYGDLTQRNLMFALYDFDRFSRHDQIGAVEVDLGKVDLGTEIKEWRDIEPPAGEDKDQKLGDICFSLRFVPTSCKLTVVILEAKNLKKMDIGGLSDPYVKMCLLANGRRIKKKKTSIKKCTLNPYFNESFTFEIPSSQIQRISLVITVVDYDRIGSSDPIGKVVVGPKALRMEEVRHWMEMLASPRRPIATWHTLREPIDPKPEEKKEGEDK